MPESPEQLYERAKDALRRPPLEEWETFPFEGDIRPRALQPPVAEERRRHGAGGVDCWRCEHGADHAIWLDERWMLIPPRQPTGLPVIVILAPRVHCDIDTMPPELAAELGPMLVRVEAAVRAVGDVGRVHVCRWGDGSEHLHWWFMARPARMPQLLGSFAAIWDDVLPPLPEEVWRANLAAVAEALRADAG